MTLVFIYEISRVGFFAFALTSLGFNTQAFQIGTRIKFAFGVNIKWGSMSNQR